MEDVKKNKISIKYNDLLNQIVEDAADLNYYYGKEDGYFVGWGNKYTGRSKSVSIRYQYAIKYVCIYTQYSYEDTFVEKENNLNFIVDYNIKLHYELCVNNEKSDLLTQVDVNATLSSTF